MRIIFVSKPIMCVKIAPVAQEKWPDEEIHLVPLCLHKPSLFASAFPKELSYSDFPLVAAPTYKPAIGEYGDFIRVLTSSPALGLSSQKHLPYDQAADFIKSADGIIFAGDPDIRDVHTFFRLMEFLDPDRSEDDVGVVLIADGTAKGSLNKAFSDIKSSSAGWYQKLLKAAFVKRYFEYNFDINALFAFRDPLNAAPGDKQIHISKYMMQALYWISENQAADYYKGVSSWNGTGKYGSQTATLGSPSSYTYIARGLVKAGLIDVPKDNRGSVFTLTDMGSKFLALLHPGCRDFDLPFRLLDWQDAGLEFSKPAIDRYIRTFFGRQKRRNELNKMKG